MKKATLAALALAGLSSVAQAEIIRWTFDNVTFDNPDYTLAGSFDYYIPQTVYDNTAITFGPWGMGNPTSWNASHYEYNYGGVDLSLDFAMPLDFGPLAVDLLGTSFFSTEGGPTFTSYVTGGQVLGTIITDLYVDPPNGGGGDNPVVGAVPEPETYAMMLAGLGLLGLARRRRSAV